MRTALLLATFLVTGSALAQEGTVHYEITTRLDIELPPEMQHMADQFPSSRTENKLLHFNEMSSLMVVAPEAEEDEDFSSSSMRRMFRRSQAENALYVDHDERKSVEKRDFMGRTFLIDGEPDPIAWRLTDEQSEFLGYPCMKATAMVKDTVKVEAWFTPQIPVSAGPDEFGGLPGLILVLTVDDGRRTFIAKEVSEEPLAEGTIAQPKDGRRVTNEEFQALVQEKMEEMQQARGGRRGFIIRG